MQRYNCNDRITIDRIKIDAHILENAILNPDKIIVCAFQFTQLKLEIGNVDMVHFNQ